MPGINELLVSAAIQTGRISVFKTSCFHFQKCLCAPIHREGRKAIWGGLQRETVSQEFQLSVLLVMCVFVSAFNCTEAK